MTRSVEIPEQAVVAALGGYDEVPTYGTPAGKRDAMRAALLAALPYLAPAGDGGLRKAQLRQEFRAEIMRGYQSALCNSDVPGWTLGDEVGKVADNLLAAVAQPAAPAVPQPVDREALERIVLDEFAGQGGLDSRVLEDGARNIADAVLAVLAGEQEQVEP